MKIANKSLTSKNYQTTE